MASIPLLSVTCIEHLCVPENAHRFLSSEGSTEFVCNDTDGGNIVNTKTWTKISISRAGEETRKPGAELAFKNVSST